MGMDIQERKLRCSAGGREEGQIWPINEIGHVRANGREGNSFPRVQLIGETVSDAPEGGEGDCPTGMEENGSFEPVERFGAHCSVWMIERSRHQRRRSKFSRMQRFLGRKGWWETRRGAPKCPHEGQYMLFMEGRSHIRVATE